MPQRSFPATRLRRLRLQPFLRELTTEHRLSAADLIMPLFVCENETQDLAISKLPGQERIPLNKLAAKARQVLKFGVPAVALFPYLPPAAKTADAAAAYQPQGLIPRAITILKEKCPELGIICDVALDPYTLSGHDGIINEAGEVENDASVEILCRQACCLAAAGCDLVAPSDMMDGRVGAIRQALDAEGYPQLPILAYSAKYASALYGPFREAVGSSDNLAGASKLSYQMSYTNAREALEEAALDLAEGADVVMVKPGNFYADIIVRLRQELNVPIFAYQVSGEYAMLCSLAAGDSDLRDKLMMESLLSLKRAGAAAILTYFAVAAAKLLTAN